MTTFHIIFPAGDETKVKVLELSSSMSHELFDYAVASRETFTDQGRAEEYAQNLAAKHNKQYVQRDRRPGEHNFLD